ncbi:MAG: DUF1127 domain-containing protein [Alphaproteobacteria bacterium]|jgi:uncharacterized protein YjiS (DUF1127 family)|nr:DUF1127 domain-containing protein [Alphaproteobacteria bacterium]
MVGNSIIRVFQSWQERSRVRSELLSMSDRQLSDIGIGRGEIDAVVRGEFVRTSRRAA